MKEIVIDIDKSGVIKLESKGFSGGSCVEATKFIENLGKVTADEKTSEYYMEENVFNSLNAKL